jgi:diguanylate cyclase (GGDEF)-like protein/PAS domain S-box-containing protein
VNQDRSTESAKLVPSVSSESDTLGTDQLLYHFLVRSLTDYAVFALSPSGVVTNWNAGAQSTFGYAQSEIVGKPFELLFSTDDVAAGEPQKELDAARGGDEAPRHRWQVRKDGTRFWSTTNIAAMYGPSAKLLGFSKLVHDNTSHDRVMQSLRHQAQFDELTDLANRRTFDQNVAQAIALMKRRPALLFAVLFLDVDRFKSVNDRYGHSVGDRLLVHVARRMELCVRAVDRTGGDEFAVLLNAIGGIADAREAAGRIGLQLRRLVTIDGHKITSSVSIGIALGNRTYETPDDVLRDADTAMYAAKLAGRGRSAIFDSSLSAGGGGTRAVGSSAGGGRTGSPPAP